MSCVTKTSVRGAVEFLDTFRLLFRFKIHRIKTIHSYYSRVFSEAPLDESSYYVVASQHAKAVIQRCSVKTGVYENFAKFTGKHLCQSLFFNKVAGLRLGKL